MDDRAKESQAGQSKAALTVEAKPDDAKADEPHRKCGLIRADELPPVPAWARRPPGKAENELFDGRDVE